MRRSAGKVTVVEPTFYLLARTDIKYVERMAAAKPGRKRARSAKVEGVTPLSAGEFQVIRALHPGFVTMMRQLDADLQREHHMSHAEFVALMFLSEASDCTLGLSELARRCQQSLSAISRTVGRMEAQGLVRREQSSQDARAYNAVLTDAGLTRLEQAVPTHVVSLRRNLFDHLEGVDLKVIGDAFERIAAAVSGDSHAIPAQPSPDSPVGRYITA
jgi:DNA-binding MarR family transcriptional regulator